MWPAPAILDTGIQPGRRKRRRCKEAVTLMTGAGFDVQPFGAFFERMTAKELDGDIPVAFLRTHPPGDQRAKLIEAAPAGGGPALTAAAWADLKAICE